MCVTGALIWTSCQVYEITYKYIESGPADSACRTWKCMYGAYDRPKHVLYGDENSWIWLIQSHGGVILVMSEQQSDIKGQSFYVRLWNVWLD